MASPRLDRRKVVLGGLGVAAGGVTLAAAPSSAPAPSSVPAAAPAPAPVSPFTFKISANVGGVSDFAPQPIFVDMVLPSRGFGTIDDVYRNTIARPALNPVDRFPAEDFALTLPKQAFSASAQVFKGKLLGLATITISSSAGFTLANIIISGDNTTFDINVPAGAEQSQALLYFTDTKRTAASATNTGCRGLVIKAHGYSIGDTTVVMPYMFDRWAPFSSLRFMDLNQTNNNVFTVTPGDRAKDGIRPMSVGIGGGQRALTLEDAVRICNTAGKNLWWNVYAAANDALIAEMGTYVRDNLARGLTALFELSNENWNSNFVQHNYWMDMVMEKVKGFSFQYVGHTVPVTYRLTSNIVTVTFTLPHGLAPGQQVAVSVLKDTSVTPNVMFGVAGIKTILSTPTPTSLTYAETHVDVPEQKAGLYRCRGGRILISASRLGGVATLHFGMDHHIPDGTVVGINGIAGASQFPVVTVIGPRDITIPCPGADGPIAIGGGTSLVSTFTDPINNFDRSRDQFALQRRMYAKRTCEMSTILQGVFGPGAFGSRLRVGLFSQPGANQDNALSYIQNSLGPPKNYLTHIGMATYFFLDATAFGGPNLRNVTTYNGNSPPSIADYAATLALTANGARTSLKDRYDRAAMNSAIYGVKMMQYEFGPDVTGRPPNGPGPVVGKQKLDTLFDPLFKPTYRVLLDHLEAAGFEEVACYNAGTCPVGSTNEYLSWGIFRNYNSSGSVRSDVISEKLAAPRTGPTRNLLAPTGTTVIDPHQILGVYVNTGNYPGLINDWVVTAPKTDDWKFTPTFHSTSTTAAVLFVNGDQVGAEYPIPIGDTTPAPRIVNLKQGVNSIRFRQGSLNLGTATQATNFSFVKV